MMTGFPDKIFSVSKNGIDELALEVFDFQYRHNILYKSYVDALKINTRDVNEVHKIPFLPISFFKTHQIKTTLFEAEVIFESSGTTKTSNSTHHVKDRSIYTRSFMHGFEHFYGPANNWCIIGLLPSYLERKNSSLVWMVDELIKCSGHPKSGFYLHEHEKLSRTLRYLESEGQQTMLIGVTFALIDFAEHYQLQLNNTIVMETGGMKGRRKELTKEQSHAFLKNRLGVDQIHSEYGMTELLSQAYSKGEGKFQCVPWMKALIRKEDDPMDVRPQGTGVLNVIDLANLYSCCFVATDDAGTIFESGAFEISGRLDNSDLRGCSLLVV
jgi:hypothetical protein